MHNAQVICPNCGDTIALQATVEEWLQPEGWLFYGEPGKRWLRCQMPHAIHFVVATNGIKQHRLAYLQEAQEIE